MAEKYTSLIALVLDQPVESVEQVVTAAGDAGDVDRASPVRGDGDAAMEVNWGGRMQKAVVRALTEGGRHLLRSEAYIGDLGVREGLKRQTALLQGLARQLRRDQVTGAVDVSAMAERDLGWVNRTAVAGGDEEHAVNAIADGTGTTWVRTHGAARFDVPDLELYGLSAGQVEPAKQALAHVHSQLLAGGLEIEPTLPDGTTVYLVPVLEAWQHCQLDWPGVGRAGQERGPGLDGPRATLSVMHKPRFGRYKTDLEGVREALPVG